MDKQKGVRYLGQTEQKMERCWTNHKVGCHSPRLPQTTYMKTNHKTKETNNWTTGNLQKM